MDVFIYSKYILIGQQVVLILVHIVHIISVCKVTYQIIVQELDCQECEKLILKEVVHLKLIKMHCVSICRQEILTLMSHPKQGLILRDIQWFLYRSNNNIGVVIYV